MGSEPCLPSKRVVNWGSSLRTVPIPTMMASTAWRSSWTKRLERGFVIHLESPVWVAMQPSIVAAHFRDNQGERSGCVLDKGFVQATTQIFTGADTNL